MAHSRYRCLFCGTELEERFSCDFSTLRSNVCEQCWQVTLQTAGPQQRPLKTRLMSPVNGGVMPALQDGMAIHMEQGDGFFR